MRSHTKGAWIAGAIAFAALLDITWGWMPSLGRSSARPDPLPAALSVPAQETVAAAALPAAAAPTVDHTKHAAAVTRGPAIAPPSKRATQRASGLETGTSGPARHALIATLDPETGRLSTDLEAPSSAAHAVDPRLEQAARSQPVTHPNGSISMNVRGWMRENFLVRIGPDGKPVPLCVDGHEQTKHALAAPARPALEVE